MHVLKRSFWKRWLLHSFVIWFIGNLFQFSNFLYKRGTGGPYLYYQDGTPVPVLDRLSGIYLNLETACIILISVFIIELNTAYFFKKKTWIFIITSLATGLSIAVLLYLNYIIQHGPIALPLQNALIVASYAFSYPILAQFLFNRILKAERMYEQSAAELHTLKAQINPHFFFNTLNSIYGTALKEGAISTAAAVEKLANMMRYILTDGSGDFVTIKSELNFVSQYIELQEMRIPNNENVHVKTCIQFDEEAVLIAPLLLLPIVENAFKYAISMERKSFIELDILVRDKNLRLNLKNSIVTPLTNGTGIGMKNVKRRLEILYSGRHRLNIDETAEIYTLELEINLQ